MKFAIKHRWSGAVLFEAELGAEYDEASESYRLGAAVRLAVKSRADLSGAYLRGADLGSADLRGAYLRGANLRGADLRGANLRGADLGSADLGSANLRGANLRGADLSRADLSGADLSGANLRGANLRGAYLRGADLGSANLRGADLSGANLRGAYLRGADLSRADLSGADLSGANLRGANLRGADLSGADLSGADLGSANGIAPELCTPLLMLLDQPGKMRAYKLVNEAGEGPINGGLKYEVGGAVSVADANTNPGEHCAAGINVATLDWCLREWQPGYRILIVEFTATDIAAIPTGTDGKFRLHRCDVVAEKAVDPAKLGLVKVAQEAA